MRFLEKKIRTILLLLFVFLPSYFKIWILNRFFSAEIHPSAKIGFSYIDVEKIRLGKDVRIGHGNVIKGLTLFQMGDFSGFGNMNRVSAIPKCSPTHLQNFPDRTVYFVMGMHSYVTGNHYFDCCGGIVIGNFTTIAGLGTSIFTHGINIATAHQTVSPVIIGNYCMVGTGCTFLMESKLPNYSILGAVSLLNKKHSQEYCLYGGIPARKIKELDKDDKYFTREKGYID